MARVVVFIDGSNLYHSLRNELGRTDLDFERFSSKLIAGRELGRIYYYNAPVDQQREPQRYREQQRFFHAMRRIPYLELKLGRLVYPSGWPQVPPYEKGVDVQMATDILIHSFRRTFEDMILVSGDTDFADALQAAKDNGQHVEVALFGPGWTSQRLRDVADKVITITPEFLENCWK